MHELPGPRLCSRLRSSTRIATAVGMSFAGLSHLTFARREFQKLVPDWLPGDRDVTVVVTGLIELGFGAALIGLPSHREQIGDLLTLFLIAVYPGNVYQYTQHRDAFGLDTDRKRAIRLLFQPPMVAAAWWSTRAQSPRLVG